MEPGSSYQTPAARTPRSRRKAISPQKSTYSSPYEAVELTENVDPDEVKKRLLEQDSLIQGLRGTVEELQTVMNDKLNDSVLIETSNKISIQERRVYQRDFDMLKKEIDRKTEENRSVRRDNEEQLSLRKRTEYQLAAANGEISDLQGKIEELTARIAELERDLRTKERTVAESECCRDLKDTIAILKKEKEKLKIQLAADRRQREELKEKVAGLERSLEESRKRELELQMKVKSQEETRKSIESALALKDSDCSREVLREIQTLSTHIISIPQAKNPDVSLIEQIGSLKTTIEFKEKQIEELREKERDAVNQIEEERKKLSETESEVNALQKQLVDFEGNKEAANLYLVEEIEKVKNQKADIRCELIMLQKKYEKTEKEMEQLKAQKASHQEVKENLAHSKTDIQALEIENAVQKQKIDALEESLAKADEKLKEKQEELLEALAGNAETKELKRVVETLEGRLAEMRTALIELDDQCEKFRELKGRAEEGRKRAMEEVAQLADKLRSAEKEQERVRASEAEVSQLRVDKERLEAKARYLNDELQEAHSDYREELARMAREISESKRRERDASEAADHSILIGDLKQKVKTHENDARSMKRQLTELKQDNEKLQFQVNDILAREKSVVEENSTLRQGLADSLAKLDQYRRELEEQREVSQGMAEGLGESEEKLAKALDEVAELEEALTEKERLVGYLQSQINVKQLPKVGRRSTLLQSLSETSLSSGTVELVDPDEIEEVQKLEREVEQLRKERDAKKQKLSERQQPVPSAPPHTPVHSGMPSTAEFKVPAARSQMLPTGQKQPPTMRHEIPHRWKDLRHMSVFSAKCAVCYVGVPYLAKARRCDHCKVVVHMTCSRRVLNTCGIPNDCANLCLDSQTVSVGRMNGWIRIFRDDTGSKSWESCWALMDDRSIAFFDQESVNGDLSKPFLKLDLSAQSFLVRAGCSVPENAEQCTQGTSIIHIKHSKMNIYMLAPSIQSAKRWTEALQAAQTRKMMLTRKPSSFSEQTCLLTLSAPNNLTIHTTTVVDECLLIGASGGLFFTQLSSNRMPVRFGGVENVLAMEVMPEINTVALITGTQKHLAMVPLSTLKAQLGRPQPAVRVDNLTDLTHLHLLAYHQQDGQKYLIVADALKLHILKYHANRDMFSVFHSIETNEPTMCLQSTTRGFFFGADSFYRIELSSTATPNVIAMVPAHVADYPIAIIHIGDDELLLAYQNYGSFVNSSGIKTREQVEWEQMPMEFVYTAPYLYVIHFDCIEIMQIAENLGQQPCKTILEEREVFTCQNAHVIGHRANGDIFVSISSKDTTEVHKFNATNSRRTMKRKGISLSHFEKFSEKRTKM